MNYPGNTNSKPVNPVSIEIWLNQLVSHSTNMKRSIKLTFNKIFVLASEYVVDSERSGRGLHRDEGERKKVIENQRQEPLNFTCCRKM